MPPHWARISQAFYLGTYEVTQGQWRAVMGNNPSVYLQCGAECPVENVSWEDVQDFIRRLNAREGHTKYRLPTEAEWEYAARAGTQTTVYTGELQILGRSNAPALDAIAWYGGNSGVTYAGGYDCSEWEEKQYRSDTCGPHPVGRKQPNRFGLYDMLGNVWEWVQDWHGVYPAGPVTDPQGPTSGSHRVLRGGSWLLVARSCRSANRSSGTPGRHSGNLGFRLLRTAP
jgi:formylglycine-generating enzyme required for sulfatase activity